MVKVKLEPTDKKEIRIIIININKTQVLSCVVIVLSQLLALINCYFLIVFFSCCCFFQWKNLHSCEDNQREWRIIRGVFRTLLPWTIFAKHKILDVFDRVLNTPPMMVSVRQRLFSRFRTFSFLTILVPTPQNGQTHSISTSAVANELLECVWPFCGVGA